MEINKTVLECMIVFLFKIEAYEACQALLETLKSIENKPNAEGWAFQVSPKEDVLH